ncbi:MAG: transporter substrate-binding domain-containing protein, partial [Bacteroidaceae bacterium]|nr:transporter substrate-binding domain-containing protein [Bacteroidaceae bacterium]
MRLIIKVIVGLWVCLALWNCSGKAAKGNTASLPDTLRVGTLYSPTCFFLFRGDTLGYEYERILNLSQKKGFEVKFSVAPNLNSLLAMLDSGIIDIIACEVPVTDEYKRRVLSCGTENVTTQVLVQMKSDSMITDVTQLVGKKVWVEKDSKYDSRLRNLDNELGGGIDIKTISSDTLGIEDLIDLVANGKIPYTLVDSDIARLNQTYYSSLDVNLQVSFPQRAAWAVALSNRQLADSINAWSESDAISSANKAVLKRYFEISRNNLEIQGPAP